MASFRPLVLALLGGLLPVAAHAADMPDLGYAPAPVQEFGSNWYLRGDVGYAMNQSPTLAAGNTYFAPVDLYDTSMDDSWTIGGGFGVKATPWLRLDFTFDYRAESDFSGTIGPYTISGAFDNWTLLANAYFDLGTWNGITPYVGGGIGAASIAPKGVNDGFVKPEFEAQWSFAWALAAGISVDFAPNWSLDLGYRYLAINDVDFGDEVYNTLVVGDLSSQEFRIGVRYLID